MIELRPTNDIYSIISGAFKKDTQLYMLYHYESPTSYDEAVDFSCAYNKIDVPKNAIFYTVYYYHLIVGFVTILDDCIWDFHISKQHRSDTVMDESWEAIHAVMPQEFCVRLYQGNYRDINWLLTEKGGGPYKLEKNKPGYYTAESDSMAYKGQEHTYFREYSQIILKFNKTNIGNNI